MDRLSVTASLSLTLNFTGTVLQKCCEFAGSVISCAGRVSVARREPVNA
jgi:hypothetical protein